MKLPALLGLSLGLGLAACSDPPAPEPAAAPAVEAPPEAQGLPEAPGQAATPPLPSPADGTTWTADTIGGLQPVPPSHSGKVPTPLSATPELDATLALLGAVVDAETTDPDNPWAIAHGLVARGPDLVLRNGQPAVDWLFATYAEPVPGHPDLLQFRASSGSTRIEPHTDLLLKALTDAGVDPGRQVTVAGRAHTVADLWRGSVVRSYLDPATNHSRYSSPDDLAWSLQGLAAWAPPGLRWTALDGTPASLDDLTDFGVAVLYKETRFLAEALGARQAFRREGQGILKYTCGGAHLVQGVDLAVQRGFGTAQGPAVMGQQSTLLRYRLDVEPEITRQALAQFPEHGDALTVQRLKFAGHYLETASRMLAMGAPATDPALAGSLEAAAAEIVAATAELKRRGMLDDLAAVRAQDEQRYFDIVGDSAHALRGLELALGRTELRW